jgi:4-hydroxy-tetrahydrodipicolinate synthase
MQWRQTIEICGCHFGGGQIMHSLAGVYSAAVTPLKADYSPDLESVPSLLSFLARRGCHGILMLGTTGEGPSFSCEERIGIFHAGMRMREVQETGHGEPCKLLAGTGTPSLTETIALTHSAFDMGFEGVVVLPPYYFRKATDEGLFQYFCEIIRKAVPAEGFLLGYHFPGVAGIGFSTELISRLKDAFPTQFAGIKDSSHDTDFAQELGKRFGSDLLVLTGTDSYLQLALENQAGGCITAPANLISPDLREIWDGYQHGEGVVAVQARVAEIRQILEKYAPFPPVLKALLAELHGFPNWPVRPPLLDSTSATVEHLVEEFLTASR